MRIGLWCFFLWISTQLVSYAGTDIERVNMTFRIEPVVTLAVESDGGNNIVAVGPVLSGSQGVSESIRVDVRSNTSQSYRVYHVVQNEVLSADGTRIPSTSLKISVTNGTQGGQSAIPSSIEMPQERTIIFNSTAEGGMDQFHIQYSVEGDQSLAAGDYYGNIFLEIEPM